MYGRKVKKKEDNENNLYYFITFLNLAYLFLKKTSKDNFLEKMKNQITRCKAISEDAEDSMV